MSILSNRGAPSEFGEYYPNGMVRYYWWKAMDHLHLLEMITSEYVEAIPERKISWAVKGAEQMTKAIAALYSAAHWCENPSDENVIKAELAGNPLLAWRWPVNRNGNIVLPSNPPTITAEEWASIHSELKG